MKTNSNSIIGGSKTLIAATIALVIGSTASAQLDGAQAGGSATLEPGDHYVVFLGDRANPVLILSSGRVPTAGGHTEVLSRAELKRLRAAGQSAFLATSSGTLEIDPRSRGIVNRPKKDDEKKQTPPQRKQSVQSKGDLSQSAGEVDRRRYSRPKGIGTMTTLGGGAAKNDNGNDDGNAQGMQSVQSMGNLGGTQSAGEVDRRRYSRPAGIGTMTTLGGGSAKNDQGDDGAVIIVCPIGGERPFVTSDDGIMGDAANLVGSSDSLAKGSLGGATSSL